MIDIEGLMFDDATVGDSLIRPQRFLPYAHL
jgi:hypothetical protein